ncbi:MAG: DUF1294 domain-containing protein [Eubacteriales bacterium]|nr:DUF1294 domain-containing protein [Eubacteriales bacterium]
MKYLYIYLGIISALAALLTLYDKRAAKRRSRRVKERTLLLVSVLGGSAAMLFAMLAVRHKTKHAKFMAGIPVIIALQIAAALAALHWRGVF